VDLLLLPQGVLPVVLVLAARMRRDRAPREVLGRDPVPAGPAERAPVLLLLRPDLRRDADLGRGGGVPLAPGVGSRRCRNAHALGECRPDLGIHAVLPFLPPPVW